MPGLGAADAALSKAKRWLSQPGAERSRLLRYKLGLTLASPFVSLWARLSYVFLSYQPDSQARFNAHPEYEELQKRFLSHNRLNNGGDRARLWSFVLNCKQVISEQVEGDFAELGVWRGNTAAVLAYFAARDNRRVFLFDTFEGFDQQDLKGVDAGKAVQFNNTSIDLVKEVIGDKARVCHFAKGYFPSTIEDIHRTRKYAIVSLDCDLYEPTKAGLNFFYPLMPRGGLFLLHDYSSCHWPGVKLAIDEFCKESGESIVLMPDKSGSAFLRKSR